MTVNCNEEIVGSSGSNGPTPIWVHKEHYDEEKKNVKFNLHAIQVPTKFTQRSIFHQNFEMHDLVWICFYNLKLTYFIKIMQILSNGIDILKKIGLVKCGRQ